MVEHNGTSILTLTEEIILDDEEKTTTYAETGETGLLLGEVSLPAPKNHQLVSFLSHVTIEAKYTGTAGLLNVRFFDGIEELTQNTIDLSSLTYTFANLSGFITCANNIAYSLKGSTQLKLRVYLVGSSEDPDAIQYCRNCVLTFIPSYKS